MADVPLMNNPMTTAGDVIYGGASGAPTRLAVGTAGQVLKVNAGATAVEWDDESGGSTDLGGKQLDYVQSTTSVTVSGTTEGAATTVVTGSSVAYDGSTAIVIEFFAPYCQLSGASSQLFVLLVEDSTVLGRLAFMTGPAGIAYPGLRGVRRLTPSNASHTYSIKAHSSDGFATINCGSGGSGSQLPMFIRITRATS